MSNKGASNCRDRGLHPDDPGIGIKLMWDKLKLRNMNRDALLTMAKWHPGRAAAALKQNRMMDEGSQRRRA